MMNNTTTTKLFKTTLTMMPTKGKGELGEQLKPTKPKWQRRLLLTMAIFLLLTIGSLWIDIGFVRDVSGLNNDIVFDLQGNHHHQQQQQNATTTASTHQEMMMMMQSSDTSTTAHSSSSSSFTFEQQKRKQSTTTKKKMKKKNRLLLVIFSNYDKDMDRQLRHAIRHTYLKYDIKIQPYLKKQPEIHNNNEDLLKICSFNNQNNQNHNNNNNNTTTTYDYDDCDIVYMFVVISSSSKVTNEKMTHDMMLLNMKKQYFVGLDNNKKDLSLIPRHLVQLAWIQHVMTTMTTSSAYNNSSSLMTTTSSSKFSHVVFADVRMIIHPNRLLNLARATTTTTTTTTEKSSAFVCLPSIFNGTTDQQQLLPASNKTTAAAITCKSDRFLILPMPLVTKLATTAGAFASSSSSSPTVVVHNINNGNNNNQVSSSSLPTTSSTSMVDLVLSLNATPYYYAASTAAAVITNNNNNIPSVQLLDGPSKEFDHRLLDLWLNYQNQLVDYNTIIDIDQSQPTTLLLPVATANTTETTTTADYFSNPPVEVGSRGSIINRHHYHHPTKLILIGIFSVLGNDREVSRRELIRSTALSYYKNYSSSTTTVSSPNRICSLTSFLRNYDDESLNQHNDDTSSSRCQLVYTFVVGAAGIADTNNNTEMVEAYWKTNRSFPLLVNKTSLPTSHYPAADSYNDDFVYLNVKENMKQGKSQSWFLYASRGIFSNNNNNNNNKTPVVFDYIAKMDSDTVLYPDKLLDGLLEEELPSWPNNRQYYGGDINVKAYEDKNALETHSGPFYMMGGFYFMSWDVARYITSRECPRSQWIVHSEDRTISNFIHTSPLPIRFRAIKQNGTKLRYFTHDRDFKEFYRYRKTWNKYIQQNHPPT